MSYTINGYDYGDYDLQFLINGTAFHIFNASVTPATSEIIKIENESIKIITNEEKNVNVETSFIMNNTIVSTIIKNVSLINGENAIEGIKVYNFNIVETTEGANNTFFKAIYLPYKCNELRIIYDDNEIKEFNESTLQIYMFNNTQNKWILCNASYDLFNNTIVIDPLTGLYGLFAEDIAPPTTTIHVSSPIYNEWVSSSTQFNLTAYDNGSGVNHTYYRTWHAGNWTNWIEYVNNFSLHEEGKYYIEFYSIDKAGNVEEINNKTYWLDNSPPVTTLKIGEPKYVGNATYINAYTLFNLTANDKNGSGVNFTWYMIDGEYHTGGSFIVKDLNRFLIL